MGLSIWTQYVLDNFATVDDAVAELSKEVFRIDDPDLPNGAKSTLHLSISDASGNSAIFEYLNGNLVIHEGRECQVMTNSPTYDKQLTLNDYWQQIGGLVMLPGTNRASDRFVRASFYIHAIPQTSNFREAVAGVFSVMRNVSVPLGITTPDQPNISSTRWRTVADQKNKVYYFESTLRYLLGRFQELGLQGRYTYQETNAHKRRDLRRKHHQRFQGQQAVTVLVRDLKD